MAARWRSKVARRRGSQRSKVARRRGSQRSKVARRRGSQRSKDTRRVTGRSRRLINLEAYRPCERPAGRGMCVRRLGSGPWCGAKVGPNLSRGRRAAFHTWRETLAWYGRAHAALAGESTFVPPGRSVPDPCLAGRAATYGLGQDVHSGRCAPPATPTAPAALKIAGVTDREVLRAFVALARRRQSPPCERSP